MLGYIVKKGAKCVLMATTVVGIVGLSTALGIAGGIAGARLERVEDIQFPEGLDRCFDEATNQLADYIRWKSALKLLSEVQIMDLSKLTRAELEKQNAMLEASLASMALMTEFGLHECGAAKGLKRAIEGMETNIQAQMSQGTQTPQ